MNVIFAAVNSILVCGSGATCILALPMDNNNILDIQMLSKT